MTSFTRADGTNLRIVSWFSCGAASAVATKMLLADYGKRHEIVVARIIVPEEHPDGDRFAADCEVWFGGEIVNLRSDQFASCQEVWERRRYMSGTNGAPCTAAMKRDVRKAFTESWRPDLQAFGYTVEEMHRADRFRKDNPEIGLICPLHRHNLTKSDCHAIIARAGIEHHAMYRLGFPNANCIGCVKNQSPAGWNLVRQHFPDVFEERARLSREIGCRLVKLTTGDRERIFLDELAPDYVDPEPVPDQECSLFCHAAADEGMP